MHRTVLLAAATCVGLSLAFVVIAYKLRATPGNVPGVPRIASVVGSESHDVVKQNVIAFSPDKDRVAVLQYYEDHWFLDGRAGVQVWLGRSMAQPASYDLVYESMDGWPDIEWVDEQHLVLTFGAQRGPKTIPPWFPSPPFMAIRNKGDVKISYRIADEVSEENYRRGLRDWEQSNRENEWRHAHISLHLDQAWVDKSSYESVKKMWKDYLTFREWVFMDRDKRRQGPTVLEDLSYDVEDVIPSPDGSRVARIVPSHNAVQPLGVASYYVVLGQRGEAREQGTIAFRSSDGMPVVTWTDNNDLTITLAHLARVQTSLHRAGEISVIYKIADRLREARFHEDLRRWRQEEEEDERKNTSNIPLEVRMSEVDRRNHRQMEYYGQFQAWVQENVPEGER